MRWLAAALAAWVFVNAALGTPPHPGVSTFGNPPELAVLWMLGALGFGWALARARDRAALARGLTLALLTATILGQRGVPAESGLRLILLALTLLTAAPLLTLGPAARVCLIALALAGPAAIGSRAPQGTVMWLGFVLPPAALALLVPALFPGRMAGRVVFMLVAATSVLCAASIASYLTLARGLDLPLDALASTRLRVLGLHPNLAVPHLVTTVLLGTALAWRTIDGRFRRRTLVLLLPTLAALYLVQSRTGLLATLLGLGLLVLTRLPWRWTRWARHLAGAAVVGLLVFPATSLSEPSITRRSSDTVVKAMSFRSAMWQVGRDTFAAAPWHGFGPGCNYAQAEHSRAGVLDGQPRDDHPHNVLLAVGESLGWPGLLALALLVGASLRRPRGADRLTDGALAALLALWACDAIDMGSAQNTIYPALAFLLLGLREAGSVHLDAAAPSASGERQAPASGGRKALARVVPVLAVGCALLGVDDLLASRAVHRATATIAALSALGDGGRSPQGAALVDEAHTQLARAARLAPFDPAVPLARARLAVDLDDRDELIAGLRDARALFPGEAAIAHQLGLALSRDDARSPEVVALLEEAVRLDPYGPQAWRRHLDLAHVATLIGRREQAFESVTEALLLNPGAVAEMAHQGSGRDLVVLPAGPGHPGIRLPDLLADIERRRAELARTDPSSELRLRMRRVDVLHALGEYRWAEQLIAAELTEDFVYSSRRSAQIAMEQGRWEDAVTYLEAFGVSGNFWFAVDYLEALSRTSPLNAARIDAAAANAEAVLASQTDVLFDLGTVSRMLAARQHAAERLGDADAALRAADALAFAAR